MGLNKRMSRMPDTIAVIGAGAWGTALANAAALAGQDVVLWARDPEDALRMEETRENARHLPGVPLHQGVRVTAALGDVAASRTLLIAVPAQALRAVCEALALVIAPGATTIICAKGIERATGFFMSDVIADVLPQAVPAILSGPSFAVDVARGLPTAVALAAPNETAGMALAHALSGPALRIYHTDDLRGVEIGGAAKNVLAIACGAVVGRGLGESARAALLARGFAELMRFARAWGGRPETLMGLSGLGDVVLSCASEQSRNFAYGAALGRGATPEEAGGGKLAEGAFTAAALVAKARARGIDMPVAEAVNAVLDRRITIGEAIEALLARPLKSETED
jgi:glycerol-3-phosphate dehydrogenase (NAD(P)+)